MALVEAINEIQSLHTEEFAAAEPRQAPTPPPIDETAIRQRHREDALSGIGHFKRKERQAAKDHAETAAQKEITHLRYQQEAQRIDHQQQLDAWWEELTRNSPDNVLWALSSAFEDNEAPVVPLGIEGDEVSLMVLVPDESTLPERMPSVTAAGNISLRKITKTQAAELYRQMACGVSLVSAKEAFVVAPGIQTLRVVAIRRTSDVYGGSRIEPLLAARFSRAAFQGVQWDQFDAWTIVSGTSSELLVQLKGAAKQMQPLDLSDHPQLGGLITSVELD